MRQARRTCGPSTPAGALFRGHRRHSRRALGPAVSVLVLALMGCTHPMQTGSNATPPGRLTLSVADAALAAGAPDMALRVADLILGDAPRDVPALVAKGDALYAMGHYDLARGAYRAAVAVDPAAVGALIGLGRTLVRTDPKAAEAAFLDAATLAPNNVTALSNLGLARDLQGRHDTAQEAYRQALAVAPDMADVKLNLGLSLALSGKTAAAIAQLHPLVGETGSTDVSPHDLAAALTLAGDQIEANLVLRGDARPADPEAPPTVADAAETPLVAVASLSPGYHAAAPDEATVPLLDIRPAPVVAVMGVPSFEAPGGPGTEAAPAPHPAQVAAPIQVTGIERPSGRHGVASAKPATARTGVVRAAAHVVGGAPRLPTRAVRDAPTGPATTARSSVSIAVAPVAVSPVAVSPVAVAPVMVAPATIAPTAVAPLAITPVVRPKSVPSAPTVEHFARLAALDSAPLARTEWQHPQSRLCGPLDGRTPDIAPASEIGGTFLRLPTNGLRTSTAQSTFCSQVPGLGPDCW
jgi:Flp pilus assembly protein TadD